MKLGVVNVVDDDNKVIERKVRLLTQEELDVINWAKEFKRALPGKKKAHAKRMLTSMVEKLEKAEGAREVPDWMEVYDDDDPFTEEGWFIVKIQVSLATTEGEPQVLVYNEDQSVRFQSPLSKLPGIAQAMGSEPKQFFRACLVNNFCNIDVGPGPAPWQDW